LKTFASVEENNHRCIFK